MKGTLLLLSLLVIGELGFQTTEACLTFFEGYWRVAFAGKTLLNSFLSKLDAQPQKGWPLKKIQDCYHEGGLKTKLLDLQVMEAVITSQECLTYHGEELVAKITDIFTRLNRLRS
eukprot:XP_002728779.2 PREDICTED: LOW QUALITY PROTEIN: androgen-binding protein homolog [Rattus norvegicus]